MNWDLLLPLVVTAAVAGVGWFVAHRLSVARDRVARRRELRTEYLIEAFRRLAKSANRDVLHPYATEIESALADIQLFGTPEQIDMAIVLIQDLVEAYDADSNPLLNSLRDELRKELGLPATERYVNLLRVSPANRDG